MFYFRINKVRILDNHKNVFLFFGDGLAQVKLISFITSDSSIRCSIHGMQRIFNPGCGNNVKKSS